MNRNCLLCLVDAGNRAVIFDKVKGLQMKVVGEGTHFKIPYIQVNAECRPLFSVLQFWTLNVGTYNYGY